MLIHLSELFNCEGRKKVYTVETALDSVDFDGETFQIEKAEPFELELTAKTRHKYTMSGHATLTVRGHCARCLEPVSFDCELDFGREFEVQDGQEESLDDEPFMKGYNLDVDQLVCNELLLSLPMKSCAEKTARGFAIDVVQILIFGLVPVTLGRSIQGCRLSRRYSMNLRRCNHVYLS